MVLAKHAKEFAKRTKINKAAVTLFAAFAHSSVLFARTLQKQTPSKKKGPVRTLFNIQ
ncbi:hypothetical protein BH09BAC3_BH09BAC3_25190 [soil metagenome]